MLMQNSNQHFFPSVLADADLMVLGPLMLASFCRKICCSDQYFHR